MASTTSFSFIYRWYRHEKDELKLVPLPVDEVRVHMMLQVNWALGDPDVKRATLAIVFKKKYYLDPKSALLFHQSLEASPKVKSFYVRKDGRVLFLKGVDGHEIDFIIPIGHGRFHVIESKPEQPVPKIAPAILPSAELLSRS